MNEQFVLDLVEKFSHGSLGELNIKEGELQIQFRSEAVAISYASAQPLGFESVSASPISALPATTGSAAVISTVAPPKKVDDTSLPAGAEVIISPIVATFYVAPSPGEAPYVTPGTIVKAGDTLCILEAMKMMNHLEAEFDCKIIKVRMENGSLVEYGQVLFEVQRM